MFWLFLLILLTIIIYWKLIKPLKYWEKRGIVYKKALPILGCFTPIVFKQKSFFEFIKDVYKQFPNERYVGIHQFTNPVLFIRDIDLIKKITIKDFDNFMDHNEFIKGDSDPLMAKMLLFLKGRNWRNMRSTLSPSFTSSKMKIMFNLLNECAEQFTEHFEKKGSNQIVVELKDIFTKFANDAIASIAFGLYCDSLKEKDNEFYLMGKELSNISAMRVLKFIILNISSSISKFLGLSFFPITVTDFFRRVIKETVEKREKEGLIRPDMIQLLMEARKETLKVDKENDNVDTGFATVNEYYLEKGDGYEKTELSIDDITAQALIFFFGGFEPISTVLSFIVYELAVNPDVQRKLQSEIDNVLYENNEKLTYEVLMKMKYLDMVISEGLRKWPPNFQVDRLCTKDYLIEPVYPHEKPLLVKKGNLIIIPIVGVHYDPKLFPDPELFDPERFSDENKHKIKSFSYLPFGSGPRNCIASRFALLELKILLVNFLWKFNVVVVDKTVIPLKLNKSMFAMMSDGGFWLGLQLRNA